VERNPSSNLFVFFIAKKTMRGKHVRNHRADYRKSGSAIQNFAVATAVQISQ
jgi:hypothetical protein